MNIDVTAVVSLLKEGEAMEAEGSKLIAEGSSKVAEARSICPHTSEVTREKHVSGNYDNCGYTIFTVSCAICGGQLRSTSIIHEGDHS